MPAAVNAQRGVLDPWRTKAPKCWNKEVPYSASVCVCVWGSCLLYGLPSTLCFAFLNRISSSKPHMAIQNSRFDSRVTEIELAPLHVCRCLSYRLIKPNKKTQKGKEQTTRPPLLCLFPRLPPHLNFLTNFQLQRNKIQTEESIECWEGRMIPTT